MRATITEAVVAGAKTGFIRDDRVIGFGLRMTTNGFKAFIVEARVQGRVRRFTIGPADRWTVADARNEARRLLTGMSVGRDPQETRRVAREHTRRGMLVARLEAKNARRASKRTARKIAKASVGADLPHHLYRHFDENGTLLYVGTSLSAFERQHRRERWFGASRTMTIEVFPTRKAAHRAETQAIQTENPLFNTQGSLRVVSSERVEAPARGSLSGGTQ